MAQNNIPSSVPEILDLADRCKAGLLAHGASLNILQYTPAGFTTLINALATKQQTFNTARAATAGAFDLVHLQQGKMRTACLMARKILSISFGDDWSAVWVPAGWTNSTTEVPKDVPALKALCTAQTTFLANHADFVVDTVKIIYTQTVFGDLVQNIGPTEDNLASARTAQGTARNNRRADGKALQSELGGLVDLLGRKLDPNSPLWDDFGLNRPGASVTPAAPGLPTLTKIAGAKVLAQTDAVAGATYYRWFTKLEGVDAEFRFHGRTQDPLVELPGQPATGILKVKCEAANEAGPGVPSPVAVVNLGA